MSKLFIIAGPNGAGKTTASMEYLKDELDCLEFLNADNIALGLSPFRPENVAIASGKIMLERMDELIKINEDFAIETTLSSKTLLFKIKNAIEMNYEIILLFYYLETPDLAIKRVANRVANGGHNIPEDVIIRRYHRGLENFFNIFISNCNFWLILNNSASKTSIIAEGSKIDLKIFDELIWKNLMVKYGKEIRNY
jgi:predicted ABC-type ATPase